MKTTIPTHAGGCTKMLAAIALAFCAVFGACADLTAPKPSCSQGAFYGKVRVTWSSVSGAAGYLLRRSTSTDFESAINIQVLTGTTYDDTYHIKHGQRYYYWVCPIDSNSDVWYNSSKYGYGSAKKLTIPVLTATDGTKTGGVTLTFKRVPTAQIYGIVRSPTKDYSDGEVIGSFVDSGAASYTVNDNTAVPGKKYYYWLLVVTGIEEEYPDGYQNHSPKSDVGWRRIVLQLYTPYSMALNQTSTIYCFTLVRNGTKVAASKLTSSCSPKKCASVIR